VAVEHAGRECLDRGELLEGVAIFDGVVGPVLQHLGERVLLRLLQAEGVGVKEDRGCC